MSFTQSHLNTALGELRTRSEAKPIHVAASRHGCPFANMLSRPCCPYFRPGNVHLAQRQSAEVMGGCPPALASKLTVNGLMPDEATDRQGNCGIDAFARSLMAQMQDGRAGVGPSASARRRRNLKKNNDKVAFLRRIGVSWLEANASEVIWPGMTVSKLCSTVSGWSTRQASPNAFPHTGRRSRTSAMAALA